MQKDIIVKGACFKIGDGQSVNVWLDRWIEGFKPKLKDESVSLDPMMVSSLINSINHTWIERKLSELFAPESVAAIKRISLPLSPKKDSLMWTKEPKGCFSVK